MKNRVLIFVKLPPPNTGATAINDYVFKSKLLEQSFDCRRLGVSYAKSVNDLGRFNSGKIVVFITTYFRFLNELIFHRPKLIYFQPSIFGIPFLRDFTFILIGHLFGLHFLLHMHGKGIAEVASKSGVKSWLYKLAFSKQSLIVLSDSQIKDIAFAKPRKVYVVPNGIPCISEISSVINKSNSVPFRFLFLSNLLRSKGILNLLRATQILKSFDKNFNLDLVGGDGDMTIEEVEMIVAEMKLSSSVFLHGAQYGNDKYQFYNNADAFIYPTTNDALPLVILEAMQFGLPVISTNEGAIPELVKDGVNGFVVDSNDLEGLTQRMAFLIDNPSICKEFGARGRMAFLEKFTIEHFEQNMYDTFVDVLIKLDRS